MSAGGRPTLSRWRARLDTVVEFSAANEGEAVDRLAKLAEHADKALERAVRGARIGASELVDLEPQVFTLTEQEPRQ